MSDARSNTERRSNAEPGSKAETGSNAGTASNAGTGSKKVTSCDRAGSLLDCCSSGFDFAVGLFSWSLVCKV